jgi:hypothetical protein
MQFFRRTITVNGDPHFRQEEGFDVTRYENAVMRVLGALSAHTVFTDVLFPRMTASVAVVPERRRSDYSCNVYFSGSHARARAGVVAGNHVMTWHAEFTPLYYCRGGVWDIRGILFHELFHVRQGRIDHHGRPPDSSYPDAEEYLAVTVTNMLSSQMGVPLRKGYLDFPDPVYEHLCALSAPREESAPGELRMRSRERALDRSDSECPHAPTEAHVREFSSYFARVRRDSLLPLAREPDLWSDLQASPAPFNPFRDLPAGNQP